MPSKRRRGRPPTSGKPTAKERLLVAARRLFARRGYDGTSVHDIAVEAGVADSALYGHFSSKAEVYRELLRDAGPQAAIDVLEAIDPKMADDAPKFVRTLLERVVEAWSSPQARTFTSIFTRDALDGRSEARGIFSEISRAQEKLGAVLRSWQESGRIRPRGEVRQLIWEIFVPLVYIRFVYLQAGSTSADVARGKTAARDHIDYVLTTLFETSP